MVCPNCNSDNTQRLSVIYQSGTQQINTRSTTFGGGGGSGFGLGTATTSTSGTAQSYLATKAAPPKKKSFGPAIGFIIAGLFLFYVNALLALVGLAVGGFLIYIASKYNKNEFPGLHSVWLKSWHCNKCGSIYGE